MELQAFLTEFDLLSKSITACERSSELLKLRYQVIAEDINPAVTQFWGAHPSGTSRELTQALIRLRAFHETVNLLDGFIQPSLEGREETLAMGLEEAFNNLLESEESEQEYLAFLSMRESLDFMRTECEAFAEDMARQIVESLTLFYAKNNF